MIVSDVELPISREGAVFCEAQTDYVRHKLHTLNRSLPGPGASQSYRRLTRITTNGYMYTRSTVIIVLSNMEGVS